MQPHSTVFFSSHLSDTGLVRKSLHPAANAATRSVCSDDAVRATMMTAERKGEGGGTDESPISIALGWSPDGVLGNTPMLLLRSSLRISLVASIPSMTGSWMSIWIVSN